MAVENARIEFLFLFEGGMPHYCVSMMYLAKPAKPDTPLFYCLRLSDAVLPAYDYGHNIIW